jgi:hypothetical protein
MPAWLDNPGWWHTAAWLERAAHGRTWRSADSVHAARRRVGRHACRHEDVVLCANDASASSHRSIGQAR